MFDCRIAANRAFRIVLFVFLVLSLGAADPPTLGSEIESLLSSEDARNAFWGIFVQDAATGQVLYELNADKALLPASNQKLITTSAALQELGGDYRYQTALFFVGTVEGSVMRGDLIIRGSGDPTFGSIDGPGPDPLKYWARSLAAMGVKQIEGRIIGDDDIFDEKPYPQGWDVDYITSQASRAIGVSASGLAYSDNVVALKIRSNSVGSAPIIEPTPTSYIEIRNQATTSSRRRGWTMKIDRDMGSDVVTLTGSIPSSFAGTVTVPVADATRFTLHSFATYLQEEKIDLSEVRLVDIDELDRPPRYEGTDPLFVHLSPPLSEILRIINKESNNFYAEQVFRTYAWGGSAEGGERRAKEFLSRAGIDVSSISIRDGSGLSRKDLVTPRALGQLLSYMYHQDTFDTFLNTLPKGGEPRSTLDYRLHNLPVRAKTGSLEFVRSLSGYITTTDGQTISFSIMTNNYSVPAYRITQVMDQIVRKMATLPALS